jgi:hypothetical protein
LPFFIKANSREIFEVSDLIKLNALYITTTTRETLLCLTLQANSQLTAETNQTEKRTTNDE